MYNYPPQYQYRHIPQVPINFVPMSNMSTAPPPRINFNYKPIQANTYIQPVNLNANGWVQPASNIRYLPQLHPQPHDNRYGNSGFINNGVIVQAREQDFESPRDHVIQIDKHYTPPKQSAAQQPQKNQRISIMQSESKTNEINDSLSIYEPTQLINKLRSSLDQNKLTSSGNDHFMIEYNNKNNQITNDPPLSSGIPLRKTKERDSGLKQIEESAIDIFSNSSSSIKQQYLEPIIESKYKIKMKRKDLAGFQWAK